MCAVMCQVLQENMHIYLTCVKLRVLEKSGKARVKLPTSKRKLTSIAAGFLLTALVLAYVFAYLGRHPSTDDAYVQADTINVAAQVTGPVASIAVNDHQLVAQDQLLFTIDPAPFQIAVSRAQAKLDAAHAALLLADQNGQRILRLVKMGQEAKAIGDQAQSQLDSARAELAADEAQLAQARLDLYHTRVTAPRAGVVTQFLLQPGNNISANNTLFLIVEQDHFWVDANFKETQVARIKPGQTVKIVLDMFPGHAFTGTVDAVSSASGAVSSLLPPENASGNWVKVTQRFPVKILIQNPDNNFPLRAGATATATIDTTMRA
jgi:membrane fusion protein (multidrug efflux system)